MPVPDIADGVIETDALKAVIVPERPAMLPCERRQKLACEVKPLAEIFGRGRAVVDGRRLPQAFGRDGIRCESGLHLTKLQPALDTGFTEQLRSFGRKNVIILKRPSTSADVT